MNDDNRPSGSAGNGQDFQSGSYVPPVQSGSPAQPSTVPPAEQHFFHADAHTPVPTGLSAVDSPSASQPLNVRMEDNSQGVSWTASEFIAHHKPPEWYMGLGIIGFIIAAVAYFVSRDIITVATIVIVAIIFAVAASRQPRQMRYAINDHGVSIGNHFYPYGNFRSFSVASEGPFRSIVLMPLKRFMPPITLYFDPADEDRIGDILVEYLPMHEHKEAATDKLMRRIRF